MRFVYGVYCFFLFKVLLPLSDQSIFNIQDEPIVKKSAYRELYALRNLQHQNVVALLESFKRRGKLYFVFEYVQKTLLQVIEESNRGLDPELVRTFLYQILKAVAWCHHQGMIHRGE